MTNPNELECFLASWESCDAKTAFLQLRAILEKIGGISLEFNARPGITYSLRAVHSAQKTRTLFAMIDIIDDDPKQRWLSVCFYDDMVTDPDEKGDWVPAGLLGEDARCFNVDELQESFIAYVGLRIQEAGKAAECAL